MHHHFWQAGKMKCGQCKDQFTLGWLKHCKFLMNFVIKSRSNTPISSRKRWWKVIVKLTTLWDVLTVMRGFQTWWSWKLVLSCCTDLERLCRQRAAASCRPVLSLPNPRAICVIIFSVSIIYIMLTQRHYSMYSNSVHKGHVNVGIVFLLIGNSQWCLYKTQSIGCRESRVL